MPRPFIYKNKRIIPLEHSELHTLFIEASDNKIGLTFNPLTPLKLIPTKSDPFKLYDMLTTSIGLKGERVCNILTVINPDLTNQPYIVLERI